MEQRDVYIFIFLSHCAVGGILGPQPGIEPSLAVRVLTTGLPWKSPKVCILMLTRFLLAVREQDNIERGPTVEGKILANRIQQHVKKNHTS